VTPYPGTEISQILNRYGDDDFSGFTGARLLAKIQRVTLRSFTQVWTTTPEQTKVLTSLHHIPEEQIINFPNFVELRPFRSKQESHNSEGPMEILTVSRFHRGKRLGNAIRAFSKLKCNRVRLRLVGGEDEEVEIELKALVKKMALEDSVIFTGPVSPLDITSYFHQADIFFLPSSYETFGIVFLEAMAAGLPIVSTCMGSIPEVVPDGKAGFLVECDDVEGMAERLDRLLADRALRNSMGQFGRKWSMGYELEDNISVFIDLYRHLKGSN